MPVTGGMYRRAVGFNRPFASLEEAKTAVLPYAGLGHEDPINASEHLQFTKYNRPSDYAALFYIQSILPELHTVFDLGGCVGNLFYSYQKDIEGLSCVEWKVLDLPKHIERGEAIAKERGVDQLKFTGDWQDASGSDLLIVSGSMHYFEPLAHKLKLLEKKPAYILINRTPLTEGPSVGAVQDKGDYRVPCMLYNRVELIRSLTEIGYAVVDEWRATELSMEIAGYPEHRIWAYSGMFLRYEPGGAQAAN
jgi:putative methyltransferase (TIGR04325 family)